jgi:hypothetical protein
MNLKNSVNTLRNIPHQTIERIEKKDKSSLFLFLFFIFTMKIVYTFTRDTFLSGPDAEAYIKSGSDIAKNGILSSEISKIPFYPIGYPIVLAFSMKLFDGSWIALFQIFQISFSCISLFLLYSILKNFFSGLLPLIAVFIVGISPAYFVLSSQAIPDNLVQFLLVIVAYRVTSYFSQSKIEIKTFHILISGAILGFALIVHPRILFLAFLSLIMIFKYSKLSLKQNMLLLISVSFIPFLASVRNLVYAGTLSLATSSSVAFAAGHSRMLTKNFEIKGSTDVCSNLYCNFQNVMNAPIEFLQDTGHNLVYFWSPHSGVLQSGVWFHNISIYRFLDSQGLVTVSKFVSAGLASVLFLLFLYGSILAAQTKVHVLGIFSLGVLFQWLVSGLIYGSNLHRMTVVHFLVPIQLFAVFIIFETIKRWKIRRLIG